MSARRENTHHARSEKRPVNRMDVSHRHFAKNRETRRARENASGFKEPDFHPAEVYRESSHVLWSNMKMLFLSVLRTFTFFSGIFKIP